MNISLRRLGWSSLACFALVGCDTAPPPPMAPTPAADPGAPAESKDKNEIKSLPVDKADSKGAAAKLADAEIAEIKKLPADEQPIALAQLVCPVSGKNLGSMDTPIKQTVDGKSFYLCCEGCVGEVEKDPAAVLAKLKK